MNTKLTTALGLTLVSALAMGAVLSTPNTEAFMGQRGERPMHTQEQLQQFKGEVTHEITKLDNGIRITLTSDNAEVVQQLQSRDHGPKPMRQNDDITRIQENISNGVKITISSENPDLVKMIQDHAENPHQRGMGKRGNGMNKGREMNEENEGRGMHRGRGMKNGGNSSLPFGPLQNQQ